MRKTTMRTAAAVMAAMLAGTACAPAVTAVSTPAVPASNASGTTTAKKEDASMKAALTEVKKRIDIPEELSKFAYVQKNAEFQAGYNFDWCSEDGSGKRINATIVDGIITEYFISGFKDESLDNREPRLAKLSPTELLKKAEENLVKLNPAMKGQLKLRIDYIYLASDTASIRFERYVNGIEVSSSGGYVDVDRDTGEITYLSVDWSSEKFPDAKKALSEEEAEKAYMSLSKLVPYYRIANVWNSKTEKFDNSAFLVYESDFDGEMDGFTGKRSTFNDDMEAAGGSYYYGLYVPTANAATGIAETADAAGADAGYDDDAALTEEELKKIDQNEKLVKSTDVVAALKKDKFVGVTDNYKLTSCTVRSENDSKGKEKFTMSLVFSLEKGKKGTHESIYVDVDAENGKVLGFSKYNKQSESKNEPKLDVKKANALAKEVVNTYAKDIISEYKPDKSNTEPVRVWTTSKQTEAYDTSRMFVYSRYVNGIEVIGEDIEVEIDSNNVVSRYRVERDESVKFPADEMISEEEAFKKLFEQKDFDRCYKSWVTKDGEFKTYLIYDIDFTLNAKTGKLCSRYDGEPIEANDSLFGADYSDIRNIPQREAIEVMADYGIKLPSKNGKFRPNDMISESEFNNILNSIIYGDIAVYEEDEGVPADSDDPEADAKAKAAAEAAAKDQAETTRREAAVMFTKLYDRNNIADLKGIFRSVYSDVKNSDENAGHIAIAYAKGFFGKTADGQFHGDKTITRAEAMQLVYDYLKLLSK